jgi:hypothetical protein
MGGQNEAGGPLRAGGQTVRLPPALSRKLLKRRVVTTSLYSHPVPASPSDVEDGRIDGDEELPALTLHRPQGASCGKGRADRVMGGGGDGDADHRQQVLRGTADHSNVAWSLVTVVYTKRGLGITALEPTRGR